MIRKSMNFLAGRKMTLVSAGFLLLSIGGIFYDIKPLLYLTWATVFISGLPIMFEAFRKLILCRCISASLLVTIAIFASIFIGEIFAASEVALIMAVGELLEDFTTERTKRGLCRLLELTPTSARKIFDDGRNKIFPLTEIRKGDVLRVLAGETIPADGIIVDGETSINQAPLTGESMMVDKTIGDEVMAGTINCFGVIDFSVSAVKNTYLQRMVNLLKDAQDKSAPIQRIVDKWAKILVPSALILSGLTYFITDEIIRAVTVLVVFCPCSFLLATPTTITAAIGQAAKSGILIKSGTALEEMGKIDLVAFDKTGTLSSGTIKVTDVTPFSETKETDLLQLISSIEQYSEHPIAKAIIFKAMENNIIPSKVTDFTMFAGKGICGLINNSQILAGNLDFLKENGIDVAVSHAKQVCQLQKEGKTVVAVSLNEKLIGIIGLSDSLRENSVKVISELKNLGITSVILTGDTEVSAKCIVQKIGISKVYANLLPDEKVFEIKKLIRKGYHVCMVGDGVNDAAALKIANVGIAMGNIGSDIAVDTADIVLINDNIESLSYLKRLSLVTIKTIKVNISLSMILNFLGITLSVAGFLTPVAGAIVHNLGSILVILNGIRIYKKEV